jgi:L-fuconolactonase
MIIDAYCHCGISKYQPVENVLDAMTRAGVGRAMLCQHIGEYDNSYLARVVAEHPGRFAATCLVDAASPTSINDLRKWHATGCFRGLRVFAGTLSSNPELCERALDLGLNLIVYTPEGIADAIVPIQRLARRFLGSHLVVSHLGNPVVRDERMISGRELLDLADEPAVKTQLSALPMFCPHPHQPLLGFIRDVIGAFGAERIMWGSNFPCDGDAEAYQQDLAFVRREELGLNEPQIEQILNSTAQRVWFE